MSSATRSRCRRSEGWCASDAIASSIIQSAQQRQRQSIGGPQAQAGAALQPAAGVAAGFSCTTRATGLPRRVITTSSPASTGSRSAESWALASARATLRMANRPSRQLTKQTTTQSGPPGSREVPPCGTSHPWTLCGRRLLQGNPQQGAPRAAWANGEGVYCSCKASNGGGGRNAKQYMQIMQTVNQCLGKIIKNLALISAPAILALGADPAKAILNINIFDDGPNLKVVVSGSLSELGSGSETQECVFIGALASQFSTICTGNSTPSTERPITGPSGFGGTAFLFPADSVSGPSFAFIANSLYAIDPSYVVGQPFLSSATFNNTSAVAQGFTIPGFVGTWTINGTSESINVFVGTSTEVPGPLPLLGACAAFGWSRRLRRRISAPVITPPQV